jgi:hypothetical protein
LKIVSDKTTDPLFVVIIRAFVLGAALFLTTSSLQNSSNPSSSLCPTMTEINNASGLQFYPITVVAEPWRGKHNVYAIFAVPLQYKEIYKRSILLVKGNNTSWYVTITDERKYGATTPEGHFLLIGFFRTRLALWYWINGKFADLQKPCNWTLHIFP